MITRRPSAERGHFDHGWLNTFHTFSFGDYFDPAHHRFHALRVINEDFVAPGVGFPTHPHRDMEILTWVLEGALEHKDSTRPDVGAVIRPGDLQHMTAGSGVEHSEFNPSKKDGVHLLQIWITPRERGLPPAYAQKSFAERLSRGGVFTVASPDGRDGSLKINQDATLSIAKLGPGQRASVPIAPGRALWAQAARGSLKLSGVALAQGDGAAVENEPAVELVAGPQGAEALVFDLA